MNTENKATLEASDRAALNCSIGMSLGDDLIVGEQIEFSDFLKEVRSCYNPESISDNSFLFVQKRVDNLMYYAWCFKEVYGHQAPCLLVCYNSVMLSPASLESVSKTIAQKWYNIVNISDTLAVAVEQVKRTKEWCIVEQILQQQDYSYLPLYDYSTKPTNTYLDSFSTDKIEKAAQTNSRICILWNKPQIETKTEEQTESKSKRRLWLRSTMVLVGIAGVVLGIVVTDLKYRQNSPIVYKGEEIPYMMEAFTVNGVEFKMIVIDGGTFHMGATLEQGNYDDDEKPVHSVTLSDYYIGETEVTQELWQAVMGSNPSIVTGNNQRPVEMVSWDDCQEFIKKLNQLTGKKFRLPTEAEWEYAARGGKYSRGYKYSGSSNSDEVAWYYGNSGDKYLSGEWNDDSIIENNCKTHPVATKEANELGLYDMSGNVWEWCNDWYGDYQRNSQTNPTGPSKGVGRVLRGGSWCSDDWEVRVSDRYYTAPDSSYSNVGLRLAL